MSARHKRPFYVFAVVAAICSLVLVTGMRGKAASPPAPEIAGPGMTTGAPAPLKDAEEIDALVAQAVATQKDYVVHEMIVERDGVPGEDPSSSPSDGTGLPEGTPGQDQDESGPDSGLSAPPGEELPGSPPTDDPDDGPSLETRPGDDKSQTNVPNPDPDGDTDGEDTDGEGEEGTPGPLDETDGPTDEGDGYSGEDQVDGQGEGQGEVDGQGEGQDVDQGLGQDVQDLVEDLGAEVDPDVTRD